MLALTLSFEEYQCSILIKLNLPQFLFTYSASGVLFQRSCLTQGHKDFPVLKFSNSVFDSDIRSVFGYYVYIVSVQRPRPFSHV